MTDSTTLVLGASSLALVVVLYVWFALALAAMFRKIGEPVWKAWVPVVNVATVLKLGGFSPWLVLINLVPLFGFIAFAVVFIVSVHRINVGFGAGGGLTVVGALVPVVWASILGFGSARWRGEAPRGVDEDSAPVRRGRDFDGPYVPLIGGWTPEPEAQVDPATDDRPIDAAPPVSEPVVQPFAAPTGSLADAVPSPSDWAPPADLRPARPGDRRPSAPPAPADTPTPAASASVFDVLDALRDGSPAPVDVVPSSPARRDARPAPADQTPDAEDSPSGWVPRPVDEPSEAAPEADALATRALLLPGTPSRSGLSRSASRTDAADGEPASAPRHADDRAPLPEDRPVGGPDGEAPSPWAGPSRRGADAPDGAAESIGEAPLTRPAATPVAAPRVSRASADEFPELSEAVSAVPDAPDAGAPRSARTSVSALYTRSEVPSDDDFDALDRTVVTRRKRIPWALIAPNGETVDLTSSVVILGRRPGADVAHPDAQLVGIVDETRTVSKTHARLELRDDTWYVTDLGSTNGVLFATLMGTEVEAPPGEEIEAGERFFLGDAEVRLTRRNA